MNPHAEALGRLGGLATSQAKTEAARRNARHRWSGRAWATAIAWEASYQLWLERIGKPDHPARRKVWAISAPISARIRQATRWIEKSRQTPH